MEHADQFHEEIAPLEHVVAIRHAPMATNLGCADNDLVAPRRQCFYLVVRPCSFLTNSCFFSLSRRNARTGAPALRSSAIRLKKCDDRSAGIASRRTSDVPFADASRKAGARRNHDKFGCSAGAEITKRSPFARTGWCRFCRRQHDFLRPNVEKNPSKGRRSLTQKSSFGASDSRTIAS